MKRTFSLFLAAVIILALTTPVVTAATNPAFAVSIAATPETVNGKSALTVDWKITANEAGLQLRGSSGLRLTYDNTVLKLIRYDGTGADYILTQTLAGAPSAGKDDIKKEWDEVFLSVRACQSADTTVGFVTIEIGHNEYTYNFIQGCEVILTSIRFAFQEGKSTADLTKDSIRLMTISEMENLNQPAALSLSVVSGIANVDHVYRSRTVADSLNAPKIILPIVDDNPPPIGEITITVTFDINSGTRTGGGELIQKIPPGGTAVAPTAIRSGYTFIGWDKSFDNVTVDITVKAQWEKSDEARDSTPVGPGKGSINEILKEIVEEIADTPDIPPTWLNPYDDVTDVDWFYDVVRIFTERNLMDGTSTNKFSPDAIGNRALLVETMYRLEGRPEVTGDVPFLDINPDAWYSDAILWASQNGIVDGYGNGKFGPDDPVTREQAVAILHRYAKLNGLDVSVSDGLSKYTDIKNISGWALDAMKWAVAVGIIKGRTETAIVPKGLITRSEVAMILNRYLNEFFSEDASLET